VPGFQRLSDAVIAFVDYLSIVEVDGMIFTIKWLPTKSHC